MFGFLKNKLKEWVDKAKDTLKTAEAEEEPEEIKEPEEEKIEKIGKKKKPRKEKIIEIEPEKTLEEKEVEVIEEIKEIKKEAGEKADKIIEEAKQEKTEPVPLEFNVALQKYEPDLEKIKEKIEEKKPGFISKLFGKKKEEKIKEEIKEEEKQIEKLEEERAELLERTPEKIEEITPEKESFFKKLKATFTYKISEEDFNRLFEDLEMLLLENNVAMEVTESIKSSLSKKLIGKEIKKDSLEKEIKTELKNALNSLIIEPDDPLFAVKAKKQMNKPFVILFFGSNGSGKTTSIAKLSYLLKEKGFSVVLAAADTFRAASIEQISEHAAKLEVPLIKHDYKADPAAVGFDAIKYAESHHIDVVLIDTAGRMHTKTNLLAEMEKIVRVTNPDLKIFVAESIAGNDATEQAKTFHEMIGIDGSILSKVDVDEKGGTIISVSYATKKPIFYLGTGQNYKDLKLFNKQEFLENLGL